MSTLREYLEISEIKEVGTGLTGIEMTREVLKDIEILDSFIVDVLDSANHIGDEAGKELMNTMIREIEKDIQNH